MHGRKGRPSPFTFVAMIGFDNMLVHRIWRTIAAILSLRLTSSQHSATALTFSRQVAGVPVHKVPLRRNDPASPYAIAASFPVRISGNFLATQVWPSARTAAQAVSQYLDIPKCNSLVEFGCGPGLPSLTAAKLGVPIVRATDLDGFALKLVSQAAQEQNISDRIKTSKFDLVRDSLKHSLPHADLYLLSDVFESGDIAQGAAHVCCEVLQQSDSRLWVFAQSDRSQREIFLKELNELLPKAAAPDSTLRWRPFEQGPEATSNIWLCDINETSVDYG